MPSSLSAAAFQPLAARVREAWLTVDIRRDSRGWRPSPPRVIPTEIGLSLWTRELHRGPARRVSTTLAEIPSEDEVARMPLPRVPDQNALRSFGPNFSGRVESITPPFFRSHLLTALQSVSDKKVLFCATLRQECPRLETGPFQLKSSGFSRSASLPMFVSLALIVGARSSQTRLLSSSSSLACLSLSDLLVFKWSSCRWVIFRS